MKNRTIDKYVVSIGDVKLRLILQTIMKHVYSLSDKIDGAVVDFNNPVDANDIYNKIDSKVAGKLIELNVFVNSKISPIIEKLVKLEKIVDGLGDFESINNKIAWLEHFIDKLDTIDQVEKVVEVKKEVKKKPTVKKAKKSDWGKAKAK